MQNDYKIQVEAVIQLRKKLAEIETRRSQYEQNVPAEVWQEFADASRGLELAEKRINKICENLSLELKQTRQQIIKYLDEYNQVREQMRQVEGLFLTNILRPGYRLKEAIRQRKWLEHEYQRIVTRLNRSGYNNFEELQADIRSVLAQSDAAAESEAGTSEEEQFEENDSMEGLENASVEEVLDAISREKLAREFKKVVLRKVHPDTSDTSEEVFKTVYEVYQRADTLMMEAYIVQYREEVVREPNADPLAVLDTMLETNQYQQRLAARLQRRIDRLKLDQTPQEENNPTRIKENMQEQRNDILARIRIEAEQILVWRQKMADLAMEYQNQQGKK
jgi:hypothetical protein